MSDPGRPELRPGITQLTLRQGEDDRARSQGLSSTSVHPSQAEKPNLPGYSVGAILGEGAHAQVWRAVQQRTNKDVAVKVYLRQRGLNWLFLQREVERLIRLDKHPHITTLFDADLSSGTPFYAMELMEHGSLEKVLALGQPVEAGRVATWLRDAAKALDYVHGKGLIHCDIKPANLLLDAQDRVRLADFGQSRILASEPGSLGTLCYMAPEQAVLSSEEEPAHPTPQWDLYSLGAVAYALLLNRAPLERELKQHLEGVGRLEDQLSVYQQALKAAPPKMEGLQVAGLDRDLAAIVDKCLELDPSRRYSRPDELLADLEARRRRRPVSPLSRHWIYRASKYLRRNGAYVFLSLLALGLGWAFVSGEIKTRRELLEAAFLLRAQNYAASGDVAAAAVVFAKLNLMQPSGYAQANARSYLSRLASPRLQWARPPVTGVALFHPDGKRLLLARGRKLQFFGVQNGRAQGEAMRHPAAVTGAVLSPDGFFVASACKDGHLRLWDSREAAAPVQDWDLGAALALPRFSNDGEFLLALAGDRELALFWDLKGKGQRIMLKSPSAIKDASFSPDSSLILSVDAGGMARLWDRASGKQVWEGAAHFGGANVGTFNRDGSAFATGGEDRKLRFWSLKRSWLGLQVAPLGKRMALEGRVTGLSFSPEGRRILAWGNDNAARIFAFPIGAVLAKPLLHEGWVRSATFSPDGTRVLSAGNDKRLRLWIARSGEALGAVLGHDAELLKAAYSPDGETVLGLSEDGVARLWETPSVSSLKTFAWPGLSQGFLSGDGKRALAYSQDGGLGILEFSKDKKPRPLKALRGRALDLRFVAPEELLLQLGDRLEFRPLDGSKAPVTFKPGPNFYSASLDPDGSRILLRYDRQLRVLGLPGMREQGPALNLARHPLDACLIPASQSCLLRFKRSLAILDLGSGRLRDLNLSYPGKMSCVAVHPGGRLFATGGEDKTIRFWDLESGEGVGEPLECPAAVAAIRFSRDGRYVLASCPSAALCQRFPLPWTQPGPEADDLYLRAQIFSRRGLDSLGKARPLAADEYARLAEAYDKLEP